VVADKTITLRSVNGPDETIIDGRGERRTDINNPYVDQYRVVVFEESYNATNSSTIQGFTIRNGSAFGGSGIYIIGGTSPTVKNNKIIENYGNFHVVGLQAAVLFEGNTVTNNTSNDKIVDFSGGFDGWVTFKNNVIVDNTFSENGFSPLIYGVSSKLRFVNNTIVVGDTQAVVWCEVCSDLNIVNSVFRGGNGSSLVNLSGLGVPPEGGPYYDPEVGIHHNNIEGSNWLGYYFGDLAYDNIDVDPSFADPANGNFELDSGSACIDAGHGDIAPATDINSKPRVNDPAVENTGAGTPNYSDMGAYERQVRKVIPGGKYPNIFNPPSR